MCLPEPEHDDDPFFDEGQTDMWGWDLLKSNQIGNTVLSIIVVFLFLFPCAMAS